MKDTQRKEKEEKRGREGGKRREVRTEEEKSRGGRSRSEEERWRQKR